MVSCYLEGWDEGHVYSICREGDIEDVRGKRDHLCDLLNLPRPKVCYCCFEYVQFHLLPTAVSPRHCEEAAPTPHR